MACFKVLILNILDLIQLWFIAMNKKNKLIYGLNQNIKIP